MITDSHETARARSVGGWSVSSPGFGGALLKPPNARCSSGSQPFGVSMATPSITPLSTPESMPLTDAGRHFDLDPDWCFLNAAYMGPMPTVAVEAATSTLHLKSHRPWEIGPVDFFEPVDRLRGELAGLIGGDTDGVAITPSVSYGIATAAANLTVGPAKRVVVIRDQFPSNVYAWREAAGRDGGEVVTVARDEAGLITPPLLAAIDERTAVVAVAPCHWTDGLPVELGAVRAACDAVGAALVLDVCQWAGAAPLDVGGIRPDYVAGACYKWLLGPYGVSFLWVAPQHREGRPLEYSWMPRADSADFAGLVDYRDEYRAGARRFDMGESANFAQVAGALAAAELVSSWGVDRVAATIGPLTGRLARGAEDLGLGVPPPGARSAHMVGLTLPDHVTPQHVADHLREERIHVSVRGRAVRVAPHVYNSVDDVDRVLAALASIVRA